jgi:hypothetical protein
MVILRELVEREALVWPKVEAKPEDAPAAVELLRLNSEHLVERGRKRAERATLGEETR